MSGSLAVAVRSTDRVALAVQVGELVPGGHGNVMVALEADTETVGGWFGGGGGVLGLRWPAHSWKIKPFGSSEGSNPTVDNCPSKWESSC